ncbi:MAG: hypothetical protein PUK74_06410, partial [Elusimicrobia bacterium]|nr:hypothetical protein [Elusimicrobiota bacterium]MDY5728629.1 hypothetical protein [Elusimicrobiaceae bacterium]
MRKTLSLLLALSVFLSPTLQAANCNYKAMLRSEKDRGWYDATCLQGLAEYVRAHKKDLSFRELLTAKTRSFDVWQELKEKIKRYIEINGDTQPVLDKAFGQWGAAKDAACVLAIQLDPSNYPTTIRGFSPGQQNVRPSKLEDVCGGLLAKTYANQKVSKNSKQTGSIGGSSAPSKEALAKAEKRYGIRVEEPKRGDLVFPQLPDMVIAPPLEKGLELFAQMLRDLYNNPNSTGEQFEGVLNYLSKDISFTPGDRNYVPPSLVRLALMYYAEKLPADRQSAAKLAKYAKEEKGKSDGFRYWAGVTAAAYAKSQNPQAPIPGKFAFSRAERKDILSALGKVNLELASASYIAWLNSLKDRIGAQELQADNEADTSADLDVTKLVGLAVPQLFMKPMLNSSAIQIVQEGKVKELKGLSVQEQAGLAFLLATPGTMAVMPTVNGGAAVVTMSGGAYATQLYPSLGEALAYARSVTSAFVSQVASETAAVASHVWASMISSTATAAGVTVGVGFGLMAVIFYDLNESFKPGFRKQYVDKLKNLLGEASIVPFPATEADGLGYVDKPENLLREASIVSFPATEADGLGMESISLPLEYDDLSHLLMIRWDADSMAKISVRTEVGALATEKTLKEVTCEYAFDQNTEPLKLRHLGKFLNPGDKPTGGRALALHQCLENARYCPKINATGMKDLFSGCSDVQVKVVPVCTEDLAPLQEAWNVKKSFINSHSKQRLYVRAVYHKNKWMPEAEDGIIGKVEEILETDLLSRIRDKWGKFLEGIIPLNKDGSMWY